AHGRQGAPAWFLRRTPRGRAAERARCLGAGRGVVGRCGADWGGGKGPSPAITFAVMAQPNPQEVTQLLVDWCDGNQQALERLMPLVMEQLKEQARRYLDRER